MMLAPVVLFVYNRLSYTRRTLEALTANKEAKHSHLYIYADGPKPSASANDIQQITKVRQLIRTQNWCGEVTVIEAEKNQGLSASIITGVTEVVNRHGRVIVLEDDLDLSPFFLQFMNDALSVYANEEDVWSVGGCNFFATGSATPETFLIRMPDCLGWATWQRAWQHFEPSGHKLLQQLTERNLQHAFNVEGTYDFTGMLEAQLRGENSSWAIRWQATAFLQNKLTLYSKHAVTNHIGLGSDATHAGNVDYTPLIHLADRPIIVKKLPVAENQAAKKEMLRTYRRLYSSRRRLDRITSGIKSLVKSILPTSLTTIYRERQAANNNGAGQWSGDYASWSEAQAASTGYDTKTILTKVETATLKVKAGEAAYERDSVVFDQITYTWPLLACMLKIASEQGNSLNLIDFGGSLGSTYFQSRSFLSSLRKLHWNVVEQPHFVTAGNRSIADDTLRFYKDVAECVSQTSANTLLLSGVLQYLENPYERVADFIRQKFDYVLIDRTAFVTGDSSLLTVQRVPPSIYEASYPAWFFNERVFVAEFSTTHELVADFSDEIDPPVFFPDGKKGYWKGFFFRRFN
jgi:putative methyltransferase (TIGR04325 family)